MLPDKNQCGQTPTPPDQGKATCEQAYRQTARLVLQDILHRLERKQGYINSLLGMLPTEMSPEQDDALWHLACELERH